MMLMWFKCRTAGTAGAPSMEIMKWLIDCYCPWLSSFLFSIKTDTGTQWEDCTIRSESSGRRKLKEQENSCNENCCCFVLLFSCLLFRLQIRYFRFVLLTQIMFDVILSLFSLILSTSSSQPFLHQNHACN